MISDRKLSRRHVLRVAAVVSASAVAVATIGDTASADPGPASTGGSGKRAELGRVVTADRSLLVVDSPAAANNSKVTTPQTVPFVGFPEHVAPRVGDLVTVTDDWPGVALAAVPVCHWVTGVPKPLAGGEFSIGGARVASSPLLTGAQNVRMSVCLLDTELPVAQVLATRPV
jgi:hypothetical protein